MKTYKVYIAGRLTDTTDKYIINVRTMILEGKKVRNAGFSVYIPALDFLSGVVTGERKYMDYFNNSIEWLKVSDAVYIIDNYMASKGTKEEINMAKRLDIPIFFNLEDLIKWKNKQDDLLIR